MNKDTEGLSPRLAALELEVARLREMVESPRGTAAEQQAEFFPSTVSSQPSATAAVTRPVAASRPRGDEVSLVSPWLARAGAVALVSGVAFAFKYAIDRGVIGPGARVVVGLLIGAALAGGGEWARRRDWLGWAQAVSGGAIGIWYLSVWAAFELYGLISIPVALVGFSAISVVGVMLALRHDSEPLAILATVTSFLNPFLVGTLRAEAVDAYVLVLDVGIVTVAWMRRWTLLTRVALLGTWLAAFSVSGLVLLVSPDGPGLAVPLLFGAAFFVLFLGHSLARASADPTSPGSLVVLVAGSFAYLGYGLALLETHAAAWLGSFAASLGLVHFMVAASQVIRVSIPRVLVRVLFFLGGAFIAIAVPLQLKGPMIPAAWTVQALVIVAVGYRSRSRATRDAGVVLLMIAILEALVVEFSLGSTYLPERLLMSGESALLALQVTATAVIARAMSATDPAERGRRQTLAVGAHVLAVIWLTLEARGHFQRIEIRNLGAGVFGLYQARAFAITAVWALYGAGLFVAGILMRSLVSRLVAVALFGAVVLKLIVADLWLVGPLYRTIAFTGLGVVLLGSSLLYHRFRDMVVGDRGEA